MIKKVILVVGLFLCLGVFSQDIHQKFHHLSRNHGLSQSTIHTIVVDSRGYFWFGTNDGLNKYDGYSFTVYRNKKEDNKSIGLGSITQIFEDSKSDLWITTNQGYLNLYNYEYDNFTRFGLNDVDLRADVNFLSICEDSRGELLIGTLNHGLVTLNKEKQKLESYEGVGKKSLDNNLCIQKLYCDSEKNIWIGTPTGVFLLNSAGQVNTSHYSDREAIEPEKSIISIFEDRFGDLWFGTYGQGAFLLNKESAGIIEYLPADDGNGALNYPIVRAFVEDRKGRLWMATSGGGINILDRETNRFSYFRHKLNNVNSLSSDMIYTFAKDKDENILIGTYNRGLDIAHYAKSRFRHVKGFGDDQSLNNNSILDFVELPDGEIWIGTDGGGINIFNSKTQKVSYISSSVKSFNVVPTLMLDSRQNIWAGTYTDGMYKLSPSGQLQKKFISEGNKLNGLTDNSIWDILEDENGNLWIATLSQGLCVYYPRTKVFKNYSRNNLDSTSLPENSLHTLFMDHKNTIWIGTDGGGLAEVIDKEVVAFKIYQNSKNKTSISSNYIRAIFEDSKQNLWVGTSNGGLNLLDRKTGEFLAYTEEEGLANNSVRSIIEDNSGNLWLGTNYGISKFKNAIYIPDYPQFTNYTQDDGLQSNEFSAKSAIKTRDGILYFGGINGFNYFHPDSIFPGRREPKLVLTDFKIFNKSIKAGDPGSPLSKHIAYQQSITISYNQSVITFDYVALGSIIPNQIEYSYILEGFDKDWNLVKNQRSVTYTNLNPGVYTFRVTARNNDGYASDENSIQIQLIVKPPFWRTAWFIILLVVFLSAALHRFYRYRINTLRRQRIQLKKMVSESTIDLEKVNQSLEATNKEVNRQSDELKQQKEDLLKANKKLEENQERIQLQNLELEKHQNNLEELVASRTTQLEDAKMNAEASERLKMAFLSNMSHEIRTPMNAIVGFASLLGDDDVSSDEREDFIKQINVNGESLLVLIDDILDLSKIEANQLNIKEEVFDFQAFVFEVYTYWKQLSLSKKGQVELLLENEIQDSDFTIKSDKHRIKQIIFNLLDNAFKFTSEGKIVLKISSQDNAIHIEVKDTGIGITKESTDYIFDRFRKGEDTGTKLYRGAGLGLTISRKLAHLLGGDLQALPNSDKGSVFYLTLPVNKIEAAKPVEKRKIESQALNNILFPNKRILIVEDEENNYLFLKGVLGKRMCELDWARNGQEAIDKVQANNYHLVLMDIKMPVMNGLDATRMIKSEFKDLIIIAQTAFARPDEESKIRGVGFNDYISKPIKKNALILMLNKYLA